MAGSSATPKSVSERILDRMESFTSRERRVAQALLANYPVAGLDTVSNFARRTGVSTATILRFINKLDFSVYSEFQSELRSQLEETLQSPLARFEQHPEQYAEGTYFQRFTEAVLANIRQTGRSLPESEFQAVVDLLGNEKRDLFVLGGRYSSSLGRYMVDLLKGVRRRATYVDGQTQKWAHSLLEIRRGSILVVFDTRRYQEDVIAFARLAAKRGAAVVLFTDQWHSDIAKVATRVLPVPVRAPSIFDSFAACLMVVEAVVGAVSLALDRQARERIEELEELRWQLAEAETESCQIKVQRTQEEDDAAR